MTWRLFVVPIVSLAVLGLASLHMPTRPASVIAVSRLLRASSSSSSASAAAAADKKSPLLSRLLVRRLLELLPAEAAPKQRAAPGPSALAHLNRTASPFLSLCAAPVCGPCDMLMLTVVHRSSPVGPPHDPHRGVVERWSRPAARFYRTPAAPTVGEVVAAAAEEEGDVGAARAALRALQAAMQPQLDSDAHDWQLLWTETLPGPIEQVAAAADGRGLALAYREAEEEGAHWSLRSYRLREPPEPPMPYGRCPPPADGGYDRAAEAAGERRGGRAAETPPSRPAAS